MRFTESSGQLHESSGHLWVPLDDAALSLNSYSTPIRYLDLETVC